MKWSYSIDCTLSHPEVLILDDSFSWKRENQGLFLCIHIHINIECSPENCLANVRRRAKTASGKRTYTIRRDYQVSLPKTSSNFYIKNNFELSSGLPDLWAELLNSLNELSPSCLVTAKYSKAKKFRQGQRSKRSFFVQHHSSEWF